MSKSPSMFFMEHPDPMWVYEVSTLRFIEVNDAAVERYGYSREQFLRMTLDDIRPSEDLARLHEDVQRSEDRESASGELWRHRLADGTLIHVDIRARPLGGDYQGMRLVCARDVTALVNAERERARALELERESRRLAEGAAEHFQALFEAVPGKYLILKPQTYEIVSASKPYLEATLTRLEQIKGRRLFEVFPDDPSDPLADGSRNLRASLRRVESLGLTDVMAVQHYPIPLPPERGGGFEDRYWSPVNTPVKSKGGEVVLIIHRVEDVTEFVTGGALAGREPAEALLEIEDRATHLRHDILLRSRELKESNTRLREQEASLRTAQRLLGIGVWRMDLDTDQLFWSENVYEIYGVQSGEFVLNYDSYVALVHPEDRAEMQAQFAGFKQATQPQFEFRHRIVRPSDGGIVHVQGVAELATGQGGAQLVGVVQSLNRQLEASAALSRATRLLRIAGKMARLGGWRVDLQEMSVTWSDQTAAIHELPEGYKPSVEEAINFYAPEYRERIRTLFGRCVETGEPFEEALQLITASGRRVWVRSLGEAERDAEGRIVAVHGAFQDIDDEVAERERHSSLAQRLTQTLSSMSEGFCFFARDLNCMFSNAEAERILGVQQGELVGRQFWEVIPENPQSTLADRLSEALERGATARESVFLVEPQIWLDISLYPSEDGLAVYFSDISAERARGEQLRLLETALSRLNDIVLITEAEPIDMPGGPKIVYVNDAFVRRTGYSRTQAIGATPRILQGPLTQRAELDRIRAALESWQPVRAELINYTATGEPLWLELDIVPIADDKGWFTHWVAVERDITERKRTDEALQISQERFQLVTRATNDVIWDWDIKLHVVWWNDSLLSAFGHDPDTINAGFEWWQERIHPEDRERVMESLLRCLEGRELVWSEEYRFQRADGSHATVIDRGFIIRDAGGEATRMLRSMLDVTERRELDAHLRQSQKLEAIGQLTGGIAHDFNNLLTVILGNAELMVERLTGHPALEEIARMTSAAASRGAELTSRLLAFARRQTLRPQTVDVGRQLQSIKGLLRRTLGEQVELGFRSASDVWPAEVDPGQLEVALLNLAINARDAMPGGGKLTMEVGNAELDEDYARDNPGARPGQYVVITVSDTGKGMSAEVVGRAFEPFFTTKEVGKGSGLGLSMVYGFVKQSGGHINVYSEEGVGTSIKLYFPRMLLPEESAGPPPALKAPIRGEGEHVLVVEDDPLVRQHVLSMLTGLGYKVSSAENGPMALQILAGDPSVELLFTDVVMPGGMDGRQLAERVGSL